MKIGDINVHRGFVLYRNGSGPVWVCPHSGPAIGGLNDRDDGSDVVAGLCWLRTGGTFIISNMPRDRVLGIDFNRTLPPKDIALSYFDILLNNRNSKEASYYKREYAFVASDEDDYKTRRDIYEDFWNNVRNSGRVIIFMHREYTYMKNFPSLMDVITYRGEGISKGVAKSIVLSINKKYAHFINSIEKHYKNEVLMNEMAFVDSVKRKYGRFDRELLAGDELKRFEQTMSVIKKFAESKAYYELDNNFNEKNFFKAVTSALNSEIKPKVTLEVNFSGDVAKKIKKVLLFKRGVVLDFEINKVFSKWYPEMVRNIVLDILSNIVSVDMYKKFATEQKSMSDFI